MSEATKDQKNSIQSTKGEASKKPEITIRSGGIAASVWLKQSTTGFYYYEFTLSRSWKSEATGKTGYATSYFHSHDEQLIEVIQKTTAWIREKLENASTTTIDTSKEAA